MMNETTLLVISLSISSLTLMVLTTVALILLRRGSHAQANCKDNVGLVQTGTPADLVGPPSVSVISQLSFAESLDDEVFASASYKFAMNTVNGQLAMNGADGLTIAVNGVRLLQSGAELTCTVSRKGRVLIANGTAVFSRNSTTRQLLPMLMDARSKKFIEMAKASGTAATVTRLGQAAAVVVTAAHLIAGADIARRMKRVEAQLDLLLQYRRIDQISKLERIYTSAKELCREPMSRDKCWELWRLRGELRELRCTWRHELQHHLNQIADPKEKHWLECMFTSRKTSNGKVQEKVTEGQLHIDLIAYSLRLDHVFALVGGTIHEFEGTLADELSEMEKLRGLLRSKVEYIKKAAPSLEVEPTLSRMTETVTAFKALILAPDDTVEPVGPSLS